MNVTFNDDQEELRTTVRAFLRDKSPEPEVRRLMETEEGYDAGVWKQMAQMLGLQGLAIPGELGGSGYTAAELTIVFEECGRALLCAPFFATVALAANALLQAGATAHLPRLASGEAIGTLALTEDSARWDEPGISLEARRRGDRYELTGHKMYVPDGLIADVIVVAARAAEGVTLFVVRGDAPGLVRTPLRTMDQTRKLARLELNGVPAEPVGAAGQGWPVVQRVLDLAAVALAAEQVGGAQRCLDMAVEYAKARVQFGRPIGSFQAIKHKCADMLLHVESARSAAYYGAWCAADQSDELPVAASLAKSYCSEAYLSVAAENIQIHGGIGFTWEHPAHLYFKRAKSSELFLGHPTAHRARLADLVLA